MENIILTMEEQKRVTVIEKVFRAELTMGKASLVLGVSERQCYRIKARVKHEGVKGVVHGNRGRPCKRRVEEKTVKRVVELARGKYRGFNDHHLTEKLEEEDGGEDGYREHDEDPLAIPALQVTRVMQNDRGYCEHIESS